MKWKREVVGLQANPADLGNRRCPHDHYFASTFVRFFSNRPLSHVTVAVTVASTVHLPCPCKAHSDQRWREAARGGAMADKRHHETVYTINEDQEWNELGTGNISATFMDRSQAMTLLVLSESSSSVVLLSRLNPNTLYQKKKWGRLIVWSEVENHTISLSFQDPEVCGKIWEDICWVQGKDPSVDIIHSLMK